MDLYKVQNGQLTYFEDMYKTSQIFAINSNGDISVSKGNDGTPAVASATYTDAGSGYWSITGRVVHGGTGVQGITISATGGLTAITDTGGYFTFSYPPVSPVALVLINTYDLTPSGVGMTFTPTHQAVDIGPFTLDQTVNFVKN